MAGYLSGFDMIALLIGCGNPRGEKIISGCLDAGLDVINIGNSESCISGVKNIKINWQELKIVSLHKALSRLNKNISFIFFNQNSSSLSKKDFINSYETLDLWKLTKDWSHSYWLSCQMPFFIIKTLHKKLSKTCNIGWMLSSYIDYKKPGAQHHSDYSGNKFTNYLIMKNFNQKYNCFGIDPDFESEDKVQKIIKNICTGKKKCNGEIF